ncbi:HK97 family phage prohead protease [Bacillota bacterium Meth-B3]
MEILDHQKGAVDLSRLSEIGVMLFNHDVDNVIGRVDSVSIEGNRGEAQVTFDEDERSQVIAEKVRSGTLKGVSVRYAVDVWEEVREGKKSVDGRFKGPCRIARKWTPFEVSIVSIPADATVGVGRDMDFEEDEKIMGEHENNDTSRGEQPVEPQAAATPTTPAEPQAQRSATVVDAAQVRADERQRIAAITEMCRTFGIDPDQHIKSGATMDQARAAVMDELMRSRAPIGAGGGVTQDEGDKFRSAAIDALLMRGGVQVEKPADGAQQLRSRRLRDMAVEVAARTQNNDAAYRMSDEDLLRSFYNPSSAFPAIMDQTVERAYAAGLRTAPVTFDKWTQRGSLGDFKKTQSRWVAGDAGELLLVPEGAEIKHDLPTDTRKPTRGLDTYGRLFTMTRQAFINDDIGFLTTIPSRYGASARRTINRAVYSILATNPVIYDGSALFSSGRKNLLDAAAPTVASINKALVAMMTQRSDNGSTLLVQPRYIICTPQMYTYFVMLLGSDALESGAFSDKTKVMMSNPFKGMGIQVISDAELSSQLSDNGGSGYEWFMVADGGSVDTIQVDYLNGVDTPTIQRFEEPNVLGFTWRIFLDWGISVMDYHGLAKNPGAQPSEL